MGYSRVSILVTVLALFGWGLALGETTAGTNAQDRLFGADKIAQIEIEVDAEGLHKLQAAPQSYVAAVVRVDGQEFRSAEVRLKGHGSFQPITGKPNFMVRLDQGSAGKQAFGHKRLLLDNSSQDRSFLRWKLASELFLKAKLPAARVNFAQVKLNGRALGPYLLVEPTDKVFLQEQFGSATGNLYEGSNTDVEDKLELDSGHASGTQPELKALASACREPDRKRRWIRLQKVLEVDRFASFMAMEVLICHHDGYSLDRNNYRIYHNPKTDRMAFIPHGMDLIFDRPDLPLDGGWGGTVARAFMETPEGRSKYIQRVAELAKLAYGSDDLEKRIESLSGFLRASGIGQVPAELEASIAELQKSVRRRKEFVGEEVARLGGQ